MASAILKSLQSFDRLTISVFILVLVARIAFAFLPSFAIDMSGWLAWSQRLAITGPAEFYTKEVWTNYTPGFLYWLWFLGKAGLVNEFLVKFPSVVADTAVGILLWRLLRKRGKKLALLGFLLYLLNPVAIFINSIWGQIDGLLAFFLFLAIFLLVERKKLILASLSLATALLIKPQAAVLVPVFAILCLKNFGLRKTFLSGITGMLFLLLASSPFFPRDPFLGFSKMFLQMGGDYSYTSVFAFNLWAMVGMWEQDSRIFFGISYFTWGLILFLTSLLGIVSLILKSKELKAVWYLACSLLYFAFFLFPTRIHERYLFPGLIFLLVATLLVKSKRLLVTYCVLSFVYLINLYYPYAYYTDNFLRSGLLLDLIGSSVKIIVVVFAFLFAWLVYLLIRISKDGK